MAPNCRSTVAHATKCRWRLICYPRLSRGGIFDVVGCGNSAPFKPARRLAMISRCQFMISIACAASSSRVCTVWAGSSGVVAGPDKLAVFAIGSLAGPGSDFARRGAPAFRPANQAASWAICSRCSSAILPSSLMSPSRRSVRIIVSACAVASRTMATVKIFSKQCSPVECAAG